MKMLWIAAALAALSAPAQAHEVWIERDGDGPARIYLGEPAEPLPAGGDPEFAKLTAPRLVPPSAAVPVRKAGYLEFAAPRGVERAWADAVFAPWGPEGKREGVVFYARAGRAEARAMMPFEIVPTRPGANAFRVLRHGRPVPGIKVTLIQPDRATRTLVADRRGAVSVPVAGRGRYLLSAAAKDEAGAPVQTLHHISTTSFVVE